MYGKVFTTMYDGTLYGHWEAIVTMQQLIVLCTADGIVDMTPQAIAARTSIPFEIITKGLKILEQPDPYTRTPGEEGRRIILIDAHRPWGWQIVNHRKYQTMRDADTVRAQTRERVRKHRESKGDRVTPVTLGNASKRYTYTDSNTDTDTPKSKAVRTRPAKPAERASTMPKDFRITDELRAWAEKKGYAATLQEHLEYFIAYAKAKGPKARYADWQAAFRNCIRADWGGLRAKAEQAARIAAGTRPGQPANRQAILDRWWESRAGVLRRAKEIGVEPYDGEQPEVFDVRVRSAAGDGPWIAAMTPEQVQILHRVRSAEGQDA